MAKLIFWLPDSFMVIGIIAIAFGLILGFLTIRRAVSLLVLIALLLISGPFVDALFDFLWAVTPLWVLVLVGVVLALTVVRFLVRLLVGSRATDVMIGVLAANGVRWAFGVSCRAVVAVLRFLVPKQLRRAVDR
jgi:hypothetical protein